MSETLDPTANAGEEVARAVGELSATAEAAANAASQIDIDHEEVKGWIKTIFEVVMTIIK